MAEAQSIAALPIRSCLLISLADEAIAIPWAIWLVIAGMALDVVSGIWDITWHFSIGIDTSWAPPHILIQTSAVLPVIACIYVILTTSFAGTSLARDASVQVLGLHAPGGVFIAAWGCVATLVAGIFDNLWHQAYGD